MALTIAVGFVVDDAIVMIENIVRYIEKGDTPLRGGAQGRGRDRLHHRVDHLFPGRRVHPAAADGRHGGRAVPRIRRHGDRRRRHVGLRLAHAHARDVRAVPAAPQRARESAAGSTGCARTPSTPRCAATSAACAGCWPTSRSPWRRPWRSRPDRLALCRRFPRAVSPAGYRLHLRPGRGARGHFLRRHGRAAGAAGGHRARPIRRSSASRASPAPSSFNPSENIAPHLHAAEAVFGSATSRPSRSSSACGPRWRRCRASRSTCRRRRI